MMRLPANLILVLALALGPTLFSQNIPRPNIFAPKSTGVEVNSLSGNVHYHKTLFQLPARGLDIELDWVYNSAHDTLDWGYGHGWTHTYNRCYWPAGQDLILLSADGRTDRYTFSNGAYHAPKGIFDTLEQYAAGQFRLTTKHGEKYFFDDANHRKLTKIEDRNSNAVLLEYAGSQLNKVYDPTGLRWLAFTWAGAHCTAVTDQFDPADPRAYTLEYSGSDLQKITGPLNGQTLFAYRQHLLERATDENGSETAVEYNAGGAATKVNSCLSRQTITYNTAGRRTYVGEQVGDANQITTYEYDTLGRNTARKGNCCGYNLGYTYDADLNVITLTDGNNNLRQFQYDTRGNTLKATDPYGDFEEYTYNAFSLITSHKDKKGNTTAYGYDVRGNLTSTQKPEAVQENYTYDAHGNNTTFTDGNGHTTQYTYDTYGNLTGIRYPTQDSVGFTYDLHGNRLTEKDGNGHVTTYVYDRLNRLLEETDALNHKTRHAYDARGNRLLLVNAKGDSTHYQYDGLDRLVEMKAPLGLTTRYAYDSRGNLLRQTDPRGAVTQYTYNDRNQPEKVTDPLGQITRYAYDGNGNRTAETDANNHTTTHEFDKLDRLLTTTDALGNTTAYVYDKNGNLTRQTDANGKMTDYTFDALNRQTTMENALGHITAYLYDKNDNLLKITDANAHATEYTYDALNRVSQEKYADNTTKTYAYDGAGNVIQRKDNSNQLTAYQYDADNRLTKRDYPGPNDDTFQYDALGQMTTALNPAATVVMVYDAAGRLSAETLNGKTTQYAYNTATGKRTLTYPSGRIVEEFYDKRSQLSLVKADAQTVAGFAYDNGGRLSTKTYGNGATGAYTYDVANRITGLLYRKNLDSLVHFQYAFDNVGNKRHERKLHHPTHSEQYLYDDTYRLTGFNVGAVAANGTFTNPVTQTVYQYDPLGNRTSVITDGVTTTYTANEMNEYTQITAGGGQPVFPTHDDNGNLTADGDRTYAYDYENRLVSVDNGATATYAYDALGRRIRKAAAGTITNFYFDGFREIEERDGADQVTATYVFGTWIDDVLQMKRGGNVYFYHPNALGSVAALTNASGGVVERYEYEGYGGVHFLDAGFGGMSGSGVGNAVLFTGRRLQEGTLGYFFRARNYDPLSGRFTQRDPLGFVDGFNLYKAYFVPHGLDPLGTQAIPNKNCQGNCNKIKQRVAWLFRGCEIPPVFCVNCPASLSPTTAWYDPLFNFIAVCQNFANNPNQVENSIKHEFQHAFDHCKGNLSDCDQHACSEIKAYKYTCSDPVRRGGQSYIQCVFQGAMNSLASSPYCSSWSNAVSSFIRVFQKCFTASPVF